MGYKFRDLRGTSSGTTPLGPLRAGRPMKRDRVMSAFADADRTAYLGYVDIPSTATDIGANQWVEAPIGNKQITVPSGGAVWSYLVDLSTLTTPAVAHVVRLHGAAI